MRNLQGNLWIPDEGYKYITNGEVYTNSIYLGKGQNINVWHDTNDEPPESEPEDEPTVEDKAEAFDILLGGAP